jgi:hypothetical protein
LVCVAYCKKKRNTNCEQSTQCAKPTWDSSVTISHDNGPTDNYWSVTSATAVSTYQYTWKTADAKLYSAQTNAGATTETIVDTMAGATYSANGYDSVSSTMFPSSTAADFDTEAEVLTHLKTSGNFFYKVGFGKKGKYTGWSFYPKRSSAWVSFAIPLGCTVTMTNAFDRNAVNGTSPYAGTPFDLTFYGFFIEGLQWEQASFGNSDVGTQIMHTPVPQFADGTLCSGSSTSYRLRADAELVVPTEKSSGCSAFATMTSAGSLPTAAIATSNTGYTGATTLSMCIQETAFTYATGCVYLTGTTSTAA